MGFDVLYLPPVHPIGTAYRKGPNNNVVAQPGDKGSPWAIGATRTPDVEGGHKSIHPDLGTLATFDSFVTQVRANGLELAMDIAFQASPDHPWVKDHPTWFKHRPDGSIQYAENPPKKYQDIYPLDFESIDWRGLWDELYSVFKFWIAHDVKIFRVDNPHTKALPFWEWCITEIHKDYPDVIFLAEAFTRPHVMYSLAKKGFTQSYTYFTWRNTKAELQEYLEEITKPPVTDFFHPNFWPNTPDILHEFLQKGGRPAFMQRVILAATLTANYGIYGPAYELGENLPAKEKSEEYLNSEKYESRVWDRAASHTIAPLITKLNQIRRTNLALQSNGSLYFHVADNPNILCYSKSALLPDGTEKHHFGRDQPRPAAGAGSLGRSQSQATCDSARTKLRRGRPPDGRSLRVARSEQLRRAPPRSPSCSHFPRNPPLITRIATSMEYLKREESRQRHRSSLVQRRHHLRTARSSLHGL